MTESFTAIDFETAQGKRHSICQVGIVTVENRIITNEVSILVQPPDNYYFYKNIEIHGITPEHTLNAPIFPAVWNKIKHYIQNKTVVAHNGAFDFDCLYKTLAYYNMEQAIYNQQCTYRIYGESLACLCKKYKISLKHHDALSDAKACAELYLRHLKKMINNL